MGALEGPKRGNERYANLVKLALHYGGGHPVPTQFSADALYYLCRSLYQMSRGEALEPPPAPMTERWLTDFWNLGDDIDSRDDDDGIDIPEGFMDNFHVEMG